MERRNGGTRERLIAAASELFAARGFRATTAPEIIGPRMSETERIVARLAPSLEPREVERCGLSVIAQAVFYRMAMPAFLHRKGWQSYPRGFGAELARHIAEFSLGGMERVAAKQSGRRRRAS